MLGVQTVDEHSDELASVIKENGLMICDGGRYVPYQSIASVQTEYKGRQDFRGIDLKLEDGRVLCVSARIEA